MSTKNEMEMIDNLPLKTYTSNIIDPKVYTFNSPYKYKEEVIYIKKKAVTHSLLGIITPEETCRMFFVGVSYIDDGNKNPPKAIIKKDLYGVDLLRVSFSLLSKVK